MNRSPLLRIVSPGATLARFAVACAFAASAFPESAVAAEQPQSVQELWADFDPRKDPLEVEVIREWKEDGGVLRLVWYFIGSFKGRPARMAAIYGFPEGTKDKLPAVMHIHGGGQRGSVSEVKMLVARGYAALSVNWGGSGTGKAPFNSCEKAEPGDPNTDWAAVDPSQLNVPGYDSMLPGPKQFFEDREHPKNNNWYLLTLGCRRGLTFLEKQPEVDPRRLGVHGYSMGGNLTMFVAGTDARVKAAVPGVGGQGWRWEAHEFGGVKARPQNDVKGDVDVFHRTLSFESYAPLVRCPVLHRSATNDFHGWMDDVYRTNALIPGQPLRFSWSPHLNHRLIPEVAVTMPLWFDHFLKGGPALPETPASEFIVNGADGIPELRVTPKSEWPVARCDIYYSLDADPHARFWRSTNSKQEGATFTAKLPLPSTDAPVFAFANVFYALPKPEALNMPGLPKEIREVCLSTMLHRASPGELRSAGVRASDSPHTLLDDFSRGWRDWYRLNEGNRDHWQNWTRKVTDPTWRGPDGAKLALTLKVAEDNRMALVLIENEWRNYRGQRRTFVRELDLHGSPDARTFTFDVADFKNTADGTPLESWSQLDLLGLCAYHHAPGKGPPAQVRAWRGKEIEFLRLEWK